MHKLENEKNKRKIILRLWGYLYNYKWLFILALALTILSNLLALLEPMLSGLAIDAIGSYVGGTNFKMVFFYCTLMLIFYIVSSGLSYVLSILMINLGQKVVYKLRKDVFDNLLNLPISFFDTHKTGDIVSRISYDIDTINASLSHDLIQILTSFITVGGSLAMMIVISPILVLVLAITLPIAIFSTKYMTTRVRPLFRKRSAKLGELNGFVEEKISGHKTIKSYNQENTMIKRFAEKNAESVEAHYKAEYYGSMTGPTINFINNFSLSLISVFGAVLYIFGKLTVGNLSSFVLYSRKFSGPINEMANIISELQSALAAAERVFKIIDEKPEPDDVENAIICRNVLGNVDLEDVTFSYVPGKPVVKNVNLSAQSGNLIAIVGPTGAGKTTIINLLMRFYDPDRGTIKLDNNNIKNVSRKSLRLSYAMVLQDTWLFSGTIYENVAYGKENATIDDVIKACKGAKIHNYIMSLPKGYDTVLNEEGMNISQGQKQLLTIARAMLLDANMLILDEATSNVDTQTEVQIQEAMYKLMENKTCFVIAHRLSTIQNADTILVVTDGMISEKGTHKQLLTKNGTYSKLFNSQFK